MLKFMPIKNAPALRKSSGNANAQIYVGVLFFFRVTVCSRLCYF